MALSTGLRVGFRQLTGNSFQARGAVRGKSAGVTERPEGHLTITTGRAVVWDGTEVYRELKGKTEEGIGTTW